MFKKYKRTQIAEMRPVTKNDIDLYNNDNKTPEYWQSRVSISQTDRERGSPKLGDMIARNHKNHQDLWLVEEQYFKDNFETI